MHAHSRHKLTDAACTAGRLCSAAMHPGHGDTKSFGLQRHQANNAMRWLLRGSVAIGGHGLERSWVEKTLV